MGKEIEKAWKATSKLIFGESLGELERYEKWLMRDVPSVRVVESAISKKSVYTPNFVYYEATKNQSITLGESLEFGKRHLKKEDVRSLTLANAAEKVKAIRHFSPEVVLGSNSGMEECAVYGECHYCFRCSGMGWVKYCAYSFWPRNSEHIFGSAWVFSSSFCIKCYHSENLTRCFEVSNSNSCADCYFCHNCDNVSDSMFCFNAKNLRHAIGNVELGKEEYARVKKLVLPSLLSELGKKSIVSHSIYNIACRKKG